MVVAINASQVLHYTKPLRRITDYMQTIVRNKKWKDVSPLSSYVEYRGNDELGLLVTTYESMLSTIQYYICLLYTSVPPASIRLILSSAPERGTGT